MRALARRVGRIEARRPVPGDGPPFLVLYPDDWPDADQAALAGIHRGARADAIERQTGSRPGPATRLNIVVAREDGSP